MKDEVPLGKLAPEGATRDAIHLAVAPVIADQLLQPGDRIGFVSGSQERVQVTTSDRVLGIVDPFLETTVKEGQRFMMVLLPNTITGMHHEWRHPAFDVLPTQKQVAVSEATVILNCYAREQGVNYGRLMDIIERRHRGNDEQMDSQVPDYVWDAWESVTGEKADADLRAEYFSCSC